MNKFVLGLIFILVVLLSGIHILDLPIKDEITLPIVLIIIVGVVYILITKSLDKTRLAREVLVLDENSPEFDAKCYELFSVEGTETRVGLAGYNPEMQQYTYHKDRSVQEGREYCKRYATKYA